MEAILKELINIHEYPIRKLLPILLMDKTTKKNIIWATDIYETLGYGFGDKDCICAELILGNKGFSLQPRVSKTIEEQQERTRKKAEVMTPVWLCNKMNNYIDKQWFEETDAFNYENDDNTWNVNENYIKFEKKKSWKKYVDSRRLEITCGEAPYLVSRYDTTTGTLIEPPINRIGILDRKLRIVNENTEDKKEWLKWSERAIQSCYGYEYQGDNLLIARINIILTFVENYFNKWNENPDIKLLTHLANIVSWNLWQMDGLKDTIPLGKPVEEFHQISLFEFMGEEVEEEEEQKAVPCKIYNWRSNESIYYKECKERGRDMSKKIFDFAVGNPPYQESYKGGSTGANSVYDKFIDASYQVADKVELIHPARFLFNAGSTPKSWNEKMLNDKHLKVMHYEKDASKIFPNTDIKGGVSITYHDEDVEFGAINIFTPYDELNHIIHKVINDHEFDSISSIAVTSSAYHFTEKLHIDYPDLKKRSIMVKGKKQPLLSKGHEYDLKSSIFDKIPEIFFDEKPEDGQEYIQILGRDKNGRSKKYIKSEYVNVVKNLNVYKIFLPKANGNGEFGEVIAGPDLEGPGVGATETFYSIGLSESKKEVENVLKYIKTKFARALLNVLKITQDVNPGKWKYVPIQNFTNESDINWTTGIHEIDLQLYKKYNLDEEEISFIENNVKEMK